jgi:hypothetical protein
MIGSRISVAVSMQNWLAGMAAVCQSVGVGGTHRSCPIHGERTVAGCMIAPGDIAKIIAARDA